MAQETVNPRLIKSNVDLYAKILKRPMVNEKVLSRPPFKFLHDLITIVIKNNGYLRGLYTEDQFQLDNINTKEAKMAFLDRLIDAVGFIYGKAADVKSAKIIAGLEATKTNKLLNDLAKAINDRKPFLQAVDSVRKGLKPPESGNSSGPTKTDSTAAGPRKASTNAAAKSSIPSKQTVNKAATKQPTTSSVTNRGTGAKDKVEKKPNASKPQPKDEEIVDERPKTQEIVKGRRNVEIVERSSKSPTPEPEQNIPDRLDLDQNQESETAVNDKNIENEDLSNKEAKVEESIEHEPILENKIETESKEVKEKEEQLEQNIVKIESAKLPTKALPKQSADEEIVEKPPKQASRIQESARSKPMKREKSSKPTKVEPEAVSDKSAALPLRSARPGSSRPAPPRVMTASRNRLQKLLDNRTAASRTEPSPGTPTTVASSPQIWPPPEGLALDLSGDNGDTDNGDDYTINTEKLQDTLFATLTDNSATTFDVSSTPGNDDAMPQKGRLMQQLLANKNVLEGTTPLKTPGDGSLQQASSGVQPTDTAQLRTFVRELCQSVATLTKAVNYLHEDVDPMISELSQWRQEYRQNLTQIEQLRTETDKQLQPLQSELDKLDKEVQEFRDKLQAAKANVFRNGINITKLIESI